MQKEIEHLKKYVLIVSFKEGNILKETRAAWLRELDFRPYIKGKKLLYREVGRGFFYIKTNCVDTIHCILNMNPYVFSRSVLIYQKWIPPFNPNKPARIFLPISVILHSLPLKYHSMSKKIVEQISQVLCSEMDSNGVYDYRYCIVVDVDKVWVDRIKIKGFHGVISEITLDYDIRLVRCKHY